MTKEEILSAIREVANKLGHPPTFSQLEDMTPMRRRQHTEAFWQLSLGIAGMWPDIEVQQPPDTGRDAFPGMGQGGAPAEEDTEHDGIRRGEPVYGGSLPEKMPALDESPGGDARVCDDARL